MHRRTPVPQAYQPIQIVALYWTDGVGTSLYAKRLERGRFQWPATSGGAVSIGAAQLGYLLEGMDWRKPTRALTHLGPGAVCPLGRGHGSTVTLCGCSSK